MLRFKAWLFLAGLLLFQTGSPVDNTPWSQLETGLNRLGSGEIMYQCYCFSVGNKPDAGCLCRWSEQGRSRGTQPRFLKMASGKPLPGEQEIWILNLNGNDHRACWKTLQQFPPKLTGKHVAWMAEASVDGEIADMPRLAEKLLTELMGKPCSVYRDEFTINMIAYAPQFKPELIMEGVPVNLNLELRYNRNLGKIRIRVGVPLLISDLEA